jgi:CHASE2 domain-containing sensor protein
MAIKVENKTAQNIILWAILILFSPVYLIGRILFVAGKLILAIAHLLMFNFGTAADEIREIKQVRASLKDAF